MPGPADAVNNLVIREATDADFRGINELINSEYYVHRHLDWRSPLDWLGSKPFLIAECDSKVVGVLSLPPDPPQVYWLRLFTVAQGVDRKSVFHSMLRKALTDIGDLETCIIPALALHNWFASLLIENGFQTHQDIIVLEWTLQIPNTGRAMPGYFIRQMDESDLGNVRALDNSAFEPIWRLSKDAMAMAFHQSNYATVCCFENDLVGYQISTGTFSTTHLARLAVSPKYQRRHVARFILGDLLMRISHTNVDRLTVNTQSTNTASLALYKSMGFERTMETFPVFQYVVRTHENINPILGI